MLTKEDKRPAAKRSPLTADIPFTTITQDEMSSFGKNINGLYNGLYRYNGNSPSVEIPSYITHIAIDAFKNCTSLKHLIIPGGVRKIMPSFKGCLSLEIVEMQDGVTDIGVDAFWLLPYLKKVIIPKSVQTISDSAFLNINYIQGILDTKSGVKASGSLMLKLQVGALSVFEKMLAMHKQTFKKYGVKGFAELIENAQFIDDCKATRQNLTIYGEPGSVAEQYARERWLKFACNTKH